MNPSDPMENGTIGGTGPLNIDAACITVEMFHVRSQQVTDGR